MQQDGEDFRLFAEIQQEILFNEFINNLKIVGKVIAKRINLCYNQYVRKIRQLNYKESAMSYEALVEKVKALPEVCLEDAYKYMQFLLYQYEQEKMVALYESDEEFETRMNEGFKDMIEGRVTPLKETFEDIKKRFA